MEAQEVRAQNHQKRGRIERTRRTNVSNEPPRGELRDSPNDDHRVSVVSFEDPPPAFPVARCAYVCGNVIQGTEGTEAQSLSTCVRG